MNSKHCTWLQCHEGQRNKNLNRSSNQKDIHCHNFVLLISGVKESLQYVSYIFGETACIFLGATMKSL